MTWDTKHGCYYARWNVNMLRGQVTYVEHWWAQDASTKKVGAFA